MIYYALLNINILAIFAAVLVVVVNGLKTEILYQTRHKTFGSIYVYQGQDGKKDMVCMTYDPPGIGTLQTCLNKKNVDRMPFEYTKIEMAPLYFFESCKDIKRILIIGLGGGILVNAYHKICPNARLDAVEINPDVYDVAKRFFYLQQHQQSANIHVHIGDGYEFMLRNDSVNYDIIILDAFIKEDMPPPFKTKQFLKLIEFSLSKRGVVLANTLKPQYNQFYYFVADLYLRRFRNLYYLESVANRMILASKPSLREPEFIVKASENFNLSSFGIERTWLLGKFILEQPEAN